MILLTRLRCATEPSQVPWANGTCAAKNCSVNSVTAWATTSVPDTDLSEMRKGNYAQQLSDLNTSRLVVNGRKWCQQAHALL